jgi:lipoprotein-anchoring transpeptidase ErfK/SrfK
LIGFIFADRRMIAIAVGAVAFLSSGTLQAEPLFGFLSPTQNQRAALQYAPTDDATSEPQTVPRLQRQVVNYVTNEAPGTVIIDTPHTVLYFVVGNNKAIRYGIGVGRQGFTWSGVQQVVRKTEWPDWYPPPEMIARQPYLPRMVAGGPGNPLGARAMYLGGTEYRIHGTNDPTTIGKQVSSGCIRLTNADVEDLYGRVHIGAKVIVLAQTHQAKSTLTATHASRPLNL